jgi:hypothetical protein
VRLFSAAVAAICALSSFQAQAQQPRVFSCEVTGSYKLEGGDLWASASSVMRGGKTNGQRFQVDRQTGAMIGDGFSSHHWSRTVVLDNGMSPRGSAYKVLYSSPPGEEFINVAYLQVYGEDGSNKTFIFVDFVEVFTGLCR